MAENLKALGNAAFKDGRFLEAVEHFTQAIALGPPSHTLLSNRSGALAALGRFDAALADAEATLAIAPQWAKGYSRKGAALYGLGRYDEALATYEAGLVVEPSNQQMAQAAADVRLKQTAAAAPAAAAAGAPAAAEESGWGNTTAEAEAPKAAAKKGGFFGSLSAAAQQSMEKTRLAAEKMAADARKATEAASASMKQMQQAQKQPAESTKALGTAPELTGLMAAAARDSAAAEAQAQPTGEGAWAAMQRSPEERKAAAERAKELGNVAFKEGQYDEAARHYSDALDNEMSAVLYSNRSGALAAAGSYDVALSDAETCIGLEPEWAKGYAAPLGCLLMAS